MSSDSTLVVRNLHFAFDETIPKHWHSGSALRSAIFNSQSLFFPAGERFFVDSVKRYIPRLSDPQLRREAQLFCGQEAVHQREHSRYNAMLARQGFPAERLERQVVRVLGLVKRLTLPRWQLAVTCALEHFTAIGAYLLLTTPDMLDGAEPRMAAFWRWHAGEETEHKAIPFDVYKAMGGFYLERVVVMLCTTLVFQVYSMLMLMAFLRTERQLFSRRTWSDLLFGQRPMWGQNFSLRSYLAYFRPGFHPLQFRTEPALMAFRRELATSRVYAQAAG